MAMFRYKEFAIAGHHIVAWKVYENPVQFSDAAKKAMVTEVWTSVPDVTFLFDDDCGKALERAVLVKS